MTSIWPEPSFDVERDGLVGLEAMVGHDCLQGVLGHGAGGCRSLGGWMWWVGSEPAGHPAVALVLPERVEGVTEGEAGEVEVDLDRAVGGGGADDLDEPRVEAVAGARRLLFGPGLDRLGDPDQRRRGARPARWGRPGVRSFGTAEDVDEHLAVGVSLFDVADRVGGVADRITPVDHRSKDAGLHHVNQRLEVLCR